MREWMLLGAFIILWGLIAYLLIKEPLGASTRGHFVATRLIGYSLLCSTVILSIELVLLISAGSYFGAVPTLLLLVVNCLLTFAYLGILEPDARRKWIYQKWQTRAARFELIEDHELYK